MVKGNERVAEGEKRDTDRQSEREGGVCKIGEIGGGGGGGGVQRDGILKSLSFQYAF